MCAGARSCAYMYIYVCVDVYMSNIYIYIYIYVYIYMYITYMYIIHASTGSLRDTYMHAIHAAIYMCMMHAGMGSTHLFSTQDIARAHRRRVGM